MLRLQDQLICALKQGRPVNRDAIYKLLQICVKESDILAARGVHLLMIWDGLHSVSVLGDPLIRLFATFGRLHEANAVFCAISKPTIYTWCAIISAHASLGEHEIIIDLYKKLIEQEGMEPSASVFVSVLKACGGAQAFEEGILIHNHIVNSGLESETMVGSMLIKLYTDCGSLDEAYNVFNRLSNQDAISWCAIIASYAQHGKGRFALELFEKMQQDGIKPDAISFSCALKACGSIASVEQGMLIHNYIIEKRIERDVVVGNTLMDMYAKFGNLQEALHVFEDLEEKNVVSWSTMVTGFVQHGLNHDAFELFRTMGVKGILPGKIACVSILKACCSTGEREVGRMVHFTLTLLGLEADVAIGSLLIDLYAKCGSLEEAHKVLEGLGSRNVFSWNALITAYCNFGLGHTALALFDCMLEEGIEPDNVTFSCALKSSGILGETTLSMELHDFIIQEGQPLDALAGNTLVNMYAKSGGLDMARKVFDDLLDKDLGTWGAMITAYAQHEHGLLALECFEKMQLGGMKPDKVSFLGVLKACGALGAIMHGKLIHDLIIRSGFEADELIGNTVVDMYAKCCHLMEAHVAFCSLSKRDTVSWNAMIVGHVQHEHYLPAFDYFVKLEEEGLKPDRVTFSGILKACSSLGVMSQGQLIHNHAIKSGFQSSMVVGSTLINMYAKCGSLIEAREVFDQMPKHGVVPWSAMIAGYVTQGDGFSALDLYLKMQMEDVNPDKVISLCVLKACCIMGAWGHGRCIHLQIVRNGLGSDIDIGTMLVTMYAKSGDIEDAQKVFHLLGQGTLACNAIIAGYGQHGDWMEARKHLTIMQEQGRKPADGTCTSVLAACSHAGQVHEAYKSFKAFTEETSMIPRAEHVVSMVDLLGRVGCFDEALKMLRCMPFLSEIGWMSLLVSCRTYGQMELGRQCFDQIVLQDPTFAASYVVMSNIYTDAQMWDAMHEVQEMRKCSGVWKLPGRAWVEVRSSVYEFFVEDKLHPACGMSYAMIGRIKGTMKDEGYVPQLDFTVRPWL